MILRVIEILLSKIFSTRYFYWWKYKMISCSSYVERLDIDWTHFFKNHFIRYEGMFSYFADLEWSYSFVDLVNIFSLNVSLYLFFGWCVRWSEIIFTFQWTTRETYSYPTRLWFETKIEKLGSALWDNFMRNVAR